MPNLIRAAAAATRARFAGEVDRGATAVEYGLLVGLIAVAIITVVTGLGIAISTTFDAVNDGMVRNAQMPWTPTDAPTQP